MLNKCKNEPFLSDSNNVSQFSSPEFNFSDQFKKIIKRYKNVGYNLDTMSGCKPNHG